MCKWIGEYRAITLTTGADNFAGTSGNDTFNGYVNVNTSANSTFTAADQINGAAGVDTLNVTLENATAGHTLPGANISNIEVINARNISGQILTIDANAIPGATNINADRSTADVTVTNVAKGAAVGVTGNGTVSNGELKFGYVAGATEATINIAGGTVNTSNAAKVTATSTGHTKVTINSTGAANAVDAVLLSAATASVTELNVNAATDLTTGNITGFTGTAAKITVAGAAAKVNLGTIENTTVKTIDASGLTAGGLTATLNTNAAITVTGGKGNDVLTTGAALVAGALVDAGEGSDTLVVAATAHLTAATGKLYKGFETLQVNTGVNADVTQLASTNTIGAIVINQTTGAATAVNNLNATQAASITVKAATTGADITIGVKDATVSGNKDTVKITLDDGVAATKGNFVFDAVNIAGVETLNVSGNENLDIKALTAATALSDVTIAVGGTAKLVTGAVNFAANSTFDFTGNTGAVTVDASAAQAGATATGLTIKGATAAANDIKDSGKADVITGGAKADTVTFTGGADIVTLGGAGDKFDFNSIKGDDANGLTFKLATGDSVVKAGATAGAFSAATAFDAAVTDLITGFDSATLAAGAGAKFTIDTDVAATGFKFGAALTFGTTTVDQAGDFFVLDNNTNEANTVYVFQDTNKDGKIDTGDMMIKLVGSAQAVVGEFAVTDGNLVFTSL